MTHLTVNEDHPVVATTFKWVESQYAAGRNAPISNDEMFVQVIPHLKREVQIGKKAKEKAEMEKHLSQTF